MWFRRRTGSDDPSVTSVRVVRLPRSAAVLRTASGPPTIGQSPLPPGWAARTLTTGAIARAQAAGSRDASR